MVTQPGGGQRVWQPASYLWNSGSEPFMEKGAQALRPHGAPSGLWAPLSPSFPPHVSLLTRLRSQHVKPAKVIVIY